MRLAALFWGLSIWAQETPASLVERAAKEAASNDSYGARRTLVRALELNPDFAPALLRLGTNLLEAGDAASAERFLVRALAAEPASAETMFQLGRMAEARRDSAGAEKRYRDAVTAQPGHARAHTALGQLLHRLDRLDEAERALAEALRLEPANTAALATASLNAARRNDAPRALALARKAVTLDPANAEYRALTAFRCQAVFDLDCAAAEFGEASRLTPAVASHFVRRAAVLYYKGNAEQAESAAARAVELAPREALALFVAALVARERGKLAEHRALLERYMDAVANEPAGYLLLAGAYEAEGNLTKAADYWVLAATSKAEYGFTYGKLAKHLASSNPSMSKYYAGKFEYYRKAAQAPEAVDLTFWQGIAAAAMGDWPLALRHYQEVARLCGKCRTAAYLPKALGLALANTGHRKEALAMLRTAPADAEVSAALRVLE